MGIVCPGCDAEPSSEATAGGPCLACGARLVMVDQADDLVGTVIDDRFEILGRLGAGGMGVVYRARQRSIDREVALKVLDRRVEQDVTSVKRFFREAKLASTLAHPNTVQVIDFGQSADRRLYLAMELVRGRDLGEEMRRVKALPVPRVIAIASQICDALEVAHGLSIVHRDLKPENVMLLDGGRDHIKILDFGLARSLDDPNSRATATGLISGTPRYIAPEVALEGADPRPPQDMYAVGVVIAELALGRPLWDASTITALFTEKLDVSASTLAVPLVLRALVRSLLQTDPARRPTAAATRAELQRIATAPAISHDVTGVIAADALANPRLVSVTDLRGPEEPPAPPPAPPGEPPPPVAFAPPEDVPEPPLELDAAWVAERTGTAGSIKHPPVTGGRPVRARRGASGYVAALVILALGGAGAYAYVKLRTHAPELRAGKGVEIVITASSPVAVEIDGHRAGTTPLRLKLARGTRPMLITSKDGGVAQVVPDHDQVVDLTAK